MGIDLFYALCYNCIRVVVITKGVVCVWGGDI